MTIKDLVLGLVMILIIITSFRELKKFNFDLEEYIAERGFFIPLWFSFKIVGLTLGAIYFLNRIPSDIWEYKLI